MQNVSLRAVSFVKGGQERTMLVFFTGREERTKTRSEAGRESCWLNYIIAHSSTHTAYTYTHPGSQRS